MIFHNEMVDPWRVVDGVKMNSPAYVEFNSQPSTVCQGKKYGMETESVISARQCSTYSMVEYSCICLVCDLRTWEIMVLPNILYLLGIRNVYPFSKHPINSGELISISLFSSNKILIPVSLLTSACQ